MTPHRKALLLLSLLVFPLLVLAVGETGWVGSLLALKALHVYGYSLMAASVLWLLLYARRWQRPALALLVGLVFVAAGAGAATAQYTNFTPRCGGVDDTAEFSSIISTIGSNTGSIRMPWVGGSRCAVGNLTVPANVALDFSNSTGLKVNTGATFNPRGGMLGPTGQRRFYNALAGQGTVSLAGNNSLPEVVPEWWMGPTNWGSGLAEVDTVDATAAIQAAVNAAIRPTSEFAISDVTTNNNPPAEMGPYGRRVKLGASGAVYKVTSTITIRDAREFEFDGNHSTLVWRGASTSTPMFYVADVLGLNFHDVRIASNNSKPLYAAFQVLNDPAASVATSTFHRYQNVVVEGRDSLNAPGGLQFGWIVGGAGSFGQNNEQFQWDHCMVNDHTEAAWAITSGQSRHHKFFGCSANGGGVGRSKRGVSLSTPLLSTTSALSGGSFTWIGGTVTTHYVADFQLDFGNDNISIIGSDSESSARFIVTRFREVNKGGLVGTVPSPASLTMTTPAGSAWAGSADVPTLVTSAGEAHTYNANKDTYVLLDAAGAFSYVEFANGTDYWSVVQPTLSGEPARLMKVVTDGSAIISVTALGGTHTADTGRGGSLLVQGCRFAAAGQLAADQAAVMIGSSVTANFQNNVFSNGSGPKVKLGMTAPDTSYDPTKLASSWTLLGNVFRDANASSKLTDHLVQIMAGAVSLTPLYQVFSRANKHINTSTGNVTVFTEESFENARLARVLGLSSTQTPARNLTGEATISDTDTEAAVTLPVAEADASYHVQLTVLQNTASAVISQPYVKFGTQATTGFTVKLPTAPGAGESVKVKWFLVR